MMKADTVHSGGTHAADEDLRAGARRPDGTGLRWKAGPGLPSSLAVPMVLAAIGAMFFSTWGCDENSFVGIEPFGPLNLISNSSFEMNHSPSLNGWSIPPGDTSAVGFSNDVPPLGGLYSVSLLNQWTFPGTIETKVRPQTGIHRYRLTAWAKAVGDGSLFTGGDMTLSAMKGDSTILGRSFLFSDTLWTKGEITAIVSSTEADRIVVRLRGNPGQWSGGVILFDLCALEALRR